MKKQKINTFKILKNLSILCWVASLILATYQLKNLK